MSTKIELVYFNIRGRAEAVRLAFLLGNVEYTDTRVTFREFGAMKKDLPYGQLPLLKLDDTRTITQSVSMLRYAGKLGGLYPMDADEALSVDEVVDVLNNDVSPKLFTYRGDDPDKLKAAREAFVSDTIPRFVEVLDKRMKEVSPEGPFLLGDNVSVADLFVTNFVNGIKQGIMDFLPLDCVDHCQVIMRTYESVMSIPQVKEWYEKYPIPNVTGSQ